MLRAFVHSARCANWRRPSTNSPRARWSAASSWSAHYCATPASGSSTRPRRATPARPARCAFRLRRARARRRPSATRSRGSPPSSTAPWRLFCAAASRPSDRCRHAGLPADRHSSRPALRGPSPRARRGGAHHRRGRRGARFLPLDEPPVVHRALSPGEITLTAGNGPVLMGAGGLVHALTESGWLEEHAEDFTEPWYLSPDALLDQIHLAWTPSSSRRSPSSASPARRPFPTRAITPPSSRARTPRDRRPRRAHARRRRGVGPRVGSGGGRSFETASAFAEELAAALRGSPARVPRASLRLASTHGSGIRTNPAPPSTRPFPPPTPLPIVPLGAPAAPTEDLDLDDFWDGAHESPTRATSEWGVAPAPTPVPAPAVVPEPSTVSRRPPIPCGRAGLAA